MVEHSHIPSASRRSTRFPRARLRCEQLEPRCLLRAGVWQIAGDQQPGNLDDMIVVERNPDNAALIRVTVNGDVVGSRAPATVRALHIYALQGNDTVRIDLGPNVPKVPIFIFGGAGDDTLIGSSGAEWIDGGRGDDSLQGDGGKDVLHGAAGQDDLDGGRGADCLLGGAGDDRLHGGRGGDDVRSGQGTNQVFGLDPTDQLRLGALDQLYEDENTNPLQRLTDPTALFDWAWQQAQLQWGYLFDQPYDPPVWWEYPIDYLPGQTPLEAVSMKDSSVSAADYSGTNTQEAGVDEQDILKTDGNYLYTVSNQELLIIDVRNPEAMAVVGRVALTGYVQGIYLQGDRVTVLSQDYGYTDTDSGPWLMDVGIGISSVGMFRPYYAQPQTVVTTIDVSDRTNPVVAQETRLDGYLNDSRAVDGQVYVVLENSLQLPTPEIVDSPNGKPCYESAESYRYRLEACFLDWLPHYQTGDKGTQGSLLTDFDVYLPMQPDGQQLLSVATFDLAGDTAGPVAVTTTAGLSGTVYASTDSLYVAAANWYVPWFGGDGSSTQLYKFGLDGDSIPLEGVGAVPGTVLDQFSMDEDDGYFRIATTSWSADQITNNIFVLANLDDQLDVVGALTDLSTSEPIYSVRFEGDRGYVVTFRTIDPLFTLDLSDPTDPHVVGELEMPGYSSYLQSIGDNYLIGLGRDADPETGSVRGLQLSLFDVSDFANPVQMDVYHFSNDTWGGYSTAEWDHHAFSFFPEFSILTLPVTTGDWWSGPAGLAVFHVTVDNGFELLGEITHDTDVLRSVRIGDVLFSLSSTEVKANSLNDPTVQMGSVALSS